MVTNQADATPLDAATGAENGGPVDHAMLENLRVGLGGPGCAEVFDSLIDLFLDSASTRVAALLAAVERGDCDEVGDEAHALKGAGATFGAARLSSLCAELEQAARGSDLDRVRELAAGLEQLSTETHAALEQVLRGSASTS